MRISTELVLTFFDHFKAIHSHATIHHSFALLVTHYLSCGIMDNNAVANPIHTVDSANRFLCQLLQIE